MKNGMKTLIAIGLLSPVLLVAAGPAEGSAKHLFVCRSPVLAFDFWNSLQDIQRKGITLTPQMAEQVCNGMRAGAEPQCLRVDGNEFKPVASGWGGALAMSNGATKIWFHNPDTAGWVHPDYYVQFVNR